MDINHAGGKRRQSQDDRLRPHRRGSYAGASTSSCLPAPENLRSQEMQPSSVRLPLRPGKGINGVRCIVKANHFLAELPDKDLHQYDVSITPEVTSRGVNRAVMAELVKLYRKSYLGTRLPAYDGRKRLYTAGPLPFESKEFRITLVDRRREREFKVVIKLAARADLHHLDMFLQGRQADAPQETLQLLDIVLRQLPTSRYSPIGRSFYSPDLGRIQHLGNGLESWHGFYQSIRPTQMGLSLNIDMTSTAFIEPLPVIEFVRELLNRNVSARSLSDSECVKIKKALRGVRVEVTHRGKRRCKYYISGLTSQATREITFPVGGTMKYLVDYFQETYGFVIQHTQLPCLQVGNSQRLNYLPMEACKIVEGQRYSKTLNEKQITALLKFSCQRPQERELDILETVRHNAYENDPYAKEFGIRVSNRLAQVEARVLPPPLLQYHESGREKVCLPQVGQWNMMNKRMVNGGVVNNWMCINFAYNVPDSVARGFCHEIAQMCITYGMDFNPEPVLPTLTGCPDQVERVLKARYHDVLTKLQPYKRELDLLIAILPENNGSLYGDLKRICETDLGIVSQCCLQKNVYRISKQYLTNVSLKINVKIGGRNTVLVDALSRRIPLVSDCPTIIFGADVTHPHPGDDSSPSIAAGTSRPTHYHVLWDENKFSADGLQTLTNSLCYTYARCTRSVSIVPPAYYARLAAFRARFYMESETSDNGSMASSTRITRVPGANAAVRPLPQLRDNVKRVMFYC